MITQRNAIADTNIGINRGEPVWRMSAGLMILIAVILMVSLAPFRDGLHLMYRWFVDRPEYSHGFIMPLLAIFLLWQQRDEFERRPFRGSWWGFALTAFGAVVLMLGSLSAVLTLVQYAYVLTLCGLMLSLAGMQNARNLMVPFAILLLMIPLPQFLFNNLTADLQLLSSNIGVAVIRLFGVSVFLEGNVIDLGTFKLEVAEACSGLRYMFPLMTLGFIMAYFYKAAMWKRVLVFLSSIPITILMNSFRIGVIGVMVDRWGQSMAEGFLHDFEGWVIFMASAAVLLLEIVLLSSLGRDRRAWREIFGLEFPARASATAPRALWQPNAPFVASCVLVAGLAIASVVLPDRVETIPQRRSFVEFPREVGGWRGEVSPLEAVYLDTLKLDDYILSTYRSPDGDLVNFFVAWYDSQRGGQSSHSPRTCIPAGGWRIENMEQVRVPDVAIAEGPLRVNRAVITNGAEQQVVYYWFQQRGRIITNEYLVKWYMFLDSTRIRRTDGSMVRLIAPVTKGNTPEQAERTLQVFLRTLAPRLKEYIPD